MPPLLPLARLRFQKSKALKGVVFFESLRDIVLEVTAAVSSNLEFFGVDNDAFFGIWGAAG